MASLLIRLEGKVDVGFANVDAKISDVRKEISDVRKDMDAGFEGLRKDMEKLIMSMTIKLSVIVVGALGAFAGFSKWMS